MSIRILAVADTVLLGHLVPSWLDGLAVLEDTEDELGCRIHSINTSCFRRHGEIGVAGREEIELC